ncbi:MAG: DUF3225 domain-containing protein [Candidatus Didemnitutus sp.]|nr:DUF3225 domain-containing protein [Candidatus Didemnitutus sp.]
MSFTIRPLLFGLLLLNCAPARAATEAHVAADIRATLMAQVEAWNTGDVAKFMEFYLKSDALRFASGGSITYGWRTTLERYQKHYPDKATMGTLAFTLHEIEVLTPDTALVFGKWELTRAQDKPWGLFTLVMKKTADGWRVASDHTSSAAKS